MGIGLGVRDIAFGRIDEEILETPQSAEAQHVPHLMKNHVREKSLGFQRLEVRSVELHRTEDRQIIIGTYVARARAAQDAALTVDIHQVYEDEKVVDVLVHRGGADRAISRWGVQEAVLEV